MTARTPRERGSMTVVLVAALAVLSLIGIVGVCLTGAASAAHRARAAADLGALAAAGALLEGVGSPCDVAGQIVERNGAQLRACELGAAQDVRVTAAVGVTFRLPGVEREAVARARAGPAQP